MSRRVCILTALAILLVAAVLLAAADLPTLHAQGGTTPTWTPAANYVLADDAYLRSGPGRGYTPVGRVIRGQQVRPAARNEAATWVMIEYGTGYGWIRRDLVDWVDNVDALDILPMDDLTPVLPTAPPPATFIFPTDTPEGSWANVNEQGAYLRAGPGRTYLVVGSIRAGDVVEPVGRNVDTSWVMIRQEEGFAWVRWDLVRWQEDVEALPILLTDALTPTLTFTPSLTPTFTATSTGTITPTFTYTPSSTPTDTLTPTATLTPTVTPTQTASATYTPSATATLTPTATVTPSFTVTPSPTPTLTYTAPASATASAAPTDTPTLTAVPTNTASPAVSLAATVVALQPPPTFTPMPRPQELDAIEPPATATPVPTATNTAEPTPAPTDTPQPTATDTPEPTAVPTDTPQPTATDTPEPTPAPTDTPQPTATDTPEPTPVPTDTPQPTATDTPEPTSVPTDTPQPTATDTPEPTPAPTNTLEPTAVAVIPTADQEPPSQPDGGESGPVADSPGDGSGGLLARLAALPQDVLIGGGAALLLALYVALYALGAAGSTRYAEGFVIETCPVCQKGELQVVNRERRLLGIPRVRRTVVCDYCGSVLRQTGRGRWRYTVDGGENPGLYRRYNGREITDRQLVALGQPARMQMVELEPPEDYEPPAYVDEE